LVILVGMCVVAVSRVIMYNYNKNHEISVLLYLAWVAIEVIAMSLFYTLFQLFALQDVRPFLAIWKNATINTSLILLLPYAILWLYFSWRDNEKMLKRIHEQEGLLSEKQKNGLISFYDEKGVMRLSVDINSLYYIESADNYVKIHYLSKGKMQHFMLRNSLKTIDELLGNKYLVRCHRSFMVNFDKIKILRKGEEGLSLDLDSDLVPDIPVSKTFSNRLMNRFTELQKEL
ncbi:MAG: LytTR family transcriptional regulator, partial [Bacteroidales bacterium]|nr:LytTR family transcriptional regulator [Bacteroidales bacterium]